MGVMVAQNVLQGRRAAMIDTRSIDPANVTTITAAEQNVALPGVRVGDAILVFPAAALTAGVTVRASIVGTADQFSFRCLNPTAADVNPVASTWAFVNLKNFPQWNIAINPASVAANAAAGQNITVPGLRIGDVVLAIPPVGLTAGVDFIAARVVAADMLPLIGANPTAGAVDAPSGTWRLVNLAQAVMQIVTLDPGNVTTKTAGNIDITVPGLRVGDCVLAVPPQTLEAGVFPPTLRVGTADTLRLRIANPSAADVNPAAAKWALVNFGQGE